MQYKEGPGKQKALKRKKGSKMKRQNHVPFSGQMIKKRSKLFNAKFAAKRNLINCQVKT